MSLVAALFASPVATVRAAAAELATAAPIVGSFADDVLLHEQRELAEARRSIDAYESALAGEIAHRSRRELGHSGLAARQGFKSPAALVQATTGSSARDAATLVLVGGLLNGESPWLAPVATAVAAGDLSAPAARAISAGLGEPVDTEARHIAAEDLTAAAESLLERCQTLTVDELARQARELRDTLDIDGAVERERAIYEQRSLRRTKRANGLYRYVIEPDIETAAFLDDVYDKLMSPRRGGPRFVDPAGQAWAEKVSTDPRTPDQYLHDSFVDLLRQAVTSNTPESRTVVGSRMPSVRVLVSGVARATGEGVGRIEGQPLPISLDTVERIACAEGTQTIAFDEQGQAINLGREFRLFTTPQRKALGARDGGCMFEGCGCPAAQTEAHHIKQWKRDKGKTDVADGILLCRFHHMLLHNNGWEIERRGATYWLIPPADVDPGRTPRKLHSKSPALQDLQRAGK